VFGNLPEQKDKSIVTVQCLSGTGALRIGAEFLNAFHKAPVYFSDPTWENHFKVFEKAGFGDLRKYKYWNG
jgi:aspartate/tyrosine/aromatic aminotransferase